MKDTSGQTPQEPRPVELTHTFQAPIDRVWEAFSKKDKIRDWWGPEQWNSSGAEMDFNEGGKFLCGMHTGTIKTIETNRRIVFLASPSGDYHETIVVDFEELGRQRTRVKIVHHEIPAQKLDECVGSWESCLNKLQKLVERH